MASPRVTVRWEINLSTTPKHTVVIGFLGFTLMNAGLVFLLLLTTAWSGPFGSYKQSVSQSICIGTRWMNHEGTDYLRDVVKCNGREYISKVLVVSGSNPYSIAPSSQTQYNEFFTKVYKECGLQPPKVPDMYEFSYDEDDNTLTCTFQGETETLKDGFCI